MQAGSTELPARQLVAARTQPGPSPVMQARTRPGPSLRSAARGSAALAWGAGPAARRHAYA